MGPFLRKGIIDFPFLQGAYIGQVHGYFQEVQLGFEDGSTLTIDIQSHSASPKGFALNPYKRTSTIELTFVSAVNDFYMRNGLSLVEFWGAKGTAISGKIAQRSR